MYIRPECNHGSSARPRAVGGCPLSRFRATAAGCAATRTMIGEYLRRLCAIIPPAPVVRFCLHRRLDRSPVPLSLVFLPELVHKPPIGATISTCLVGLRRSLARKYMVLVPLFDLKFLYALVATAVRTSNRRHWAPRSTWAARVRWIGWYKNAGDIAAVRALIGDQPWFVELRRDADNLFHVQRTAPRAR